jgi:hypothetical protein
MSFYGGGRVTESDPFELTEEEARGLAAIITALEENKVNFVSIAISVISDETQDLIVSIRGVRKA